jgi:hypothetical protein
LYFSQCDTWSSRINLVSVRATDQEAKVDIPVEAEHAEERYGEAVVVPAEDRVDGAGDEDGGPGVEPGEGGVQLLEAGSVVLPVVEQLPEGRGRAGAARLLPVYPVQGVGEEKEDGHRHLQGAVAGPCQVEYIY